MKRWKKIIHANSNQRRAQVPVLVPDKVDFKLKGCKRQRRTYINKRFNTERRHIYASSEEHQNI